MEQKPIGEKAKVKYAKVFLEFGFDMLQGEVAELSGRLSDSVVRAELIASLDDWTLDEEPATQQRLDRIAAMVTGENWR